jgi:Fe-S-cluster containining protein
MADLDTRVHGGMTEALEGLSHRNVDREDLLDPEEIRVRNKGRKWIMPDCANCTERCCVHDDPGSGILLSLRDVANLVDSGLGHLIVGKFTFKRSKKGKILDEIDQMPRLAKQPDGNCHFYDPDTGMCTGYGVRPTICRRFPYEVEYKKKSGKPFARFIGWSQCPTLEGDEYADSIRQMARDAVVDENVSYEDAVLLGEHVEELRAAGFDEFLPPPEECPGGGSTRGSNGKGS